MSENREFGQNNENTAFEQSNENAVFEQNNENTAFGQETESGVTDRADKGAGEEAVNEEGALPQTDMEQMSERRKKRVRQKKILDFILNLVIIAAVCVFIYSGYKLIVTLKDYADGKNYYEGVGSLFPTLPTDEAETPAETEKETSGETEAETNAGGTTEAETSGDDQTFAPSTEDGSSAGTDWKAFYAQMKAMNPDYVGWIVIKDTPINYPIVQAEDNDYYLHRLFDGTYNYAGTLFVDYRSDNLFHTGNTIIHGHNMKNGTMFNGLLNYRTEEFYKTHTTFSVYTEEGEIVYEIFSIHATNPVSTSYITEFSGDDEYISWMQSMYAQSTVKPGMDFDPDTAVLTLSTCVNDGRNRLIIQARRITP